jgi:serralysin
VAKILGAVFGPASVRNAEYAGIGLQLIDGGWSYDALMRLALDARLGAGASNAAVVDLLYTNVVGVAPSTAEHDLYVGLLNNNTYTQTSLAITAAETDLNKIAIDLVGLTQSGLTFS